MPAANSDLTEPVVLLESSVTPPTDDGRLNKLLAWFKAAPPQRKAATQADSAEAKRAPEEFGGFIDMVKAAHPTRPVVAVLCWLGRCEAGADSGAGGDSGDGGAGHADGAAASVAADGGAAKTKQSTKQKQSKSKKQRLTEAATAKGVELCVMDTSGLHMLHVRTTR